MKNSVAPNTIRGWIKAFKRDGLRGLVDEMCIRDSFCHIDSKFFGHSTKVV